MKNFDFSKRILQTKIGISSFFRQNRKMIYFIFLFVLLGLLTGIFTGLKWTSGIGLESFNDKITIEYASQEISGFIFVIKRLLGILFFCLIVILCCSRPILNLFAILLLIYKAYLYGIDIAVIIQLFGFAGILNVVIIIIPSILLYLFALSFFTLILLMGCNNLKKMNECIFSKFFLYEYGNALLIFIGLIFFSIIFELLFLPNININVIIN